MSNDNKLRNVMMEAHSLCPTDMSHIQRMAWMADYFVQHSALPAEKPAAAATVDSVYAALSDHEKRYTSRENVAAVLRSMPAAAAERAAVMLTDALIDERAWAGGLIDRSGACGFVSGSDLRPRLRVLVRSLATPPAQAAQADVEALYREVGRKMVEITTTVRGPEEWLCIPELWLECLRERDSLKAAATK